MRGQKLETGTGVAAEGGHMHYSTVLYAVVLRARCTTGVWVNGIMILIDTACSCCTFLHDAHFYSMFSDAPKKKKVLVACCCFLLSSIAITATLAIRCVIESALCCRISAAKLLKF